MKKVLIITYYWPPSGGGGVMRWLKMSKFLPELGWQPVIFTPENPDPSVIDESLLQEIHPETIEIKTPIWEPYHLYRKLTGKKSGAKFKAGYISEASEGSWKSRLSVFIRGNFLIPDPRIFWVSPSINFLTKYLKENPVDLIVSTGPPHSMHLIALGLKKKFEIPWIADFRDPWTDIDFYHKLKLTRLADKKHRQLEKKVLSTADYLVTVSRGCAEGLLKIGNRKIEVVTNGYDPSDYEFEKPGLDKTFTISHFGAFNKDRNPVALWLAMDELATENPDFRNLLRIKLYGQTDASVINDIKKHNLTDNLVIIEHLPHQKGLVELCKSQVLLLPLNNTPNVKGILTGKMFEYIALQRPILAIGPTDADFAEILRETNSGISLNFDDLPGIKNALQNYFNLFNENKLMVKPGAYEKYSRKNLAKQFVNLIQP